jgi:methionyl-tRNA synthetase
VYWPALLTAANLSLPERVIAHGHWLNGLQKMSKSAGNVIDPLQVITDDFQGSSDPLRYFLLRTGRIDADGHFNREAVKECYQRELVGSLGNLISRTFKNCTTQVVPGCHSHISAPIAEAIERFNEQLPRHFSNYRLSGVADCLQSLLASGNSYLSSEEPWNNTTLWPQCRANIRSLLQTSLQACEPLIPAAAEEIKRILIGEQVVKPGGLFPKLPRTG